MSAGVGKSYRMLQEAPTLLKNGVAVKIGFIETDKRVETEAVVTGLLHISRRKLVYNRYFKATAVPRLGSNGKSGNTGLGLAISREFITAMNGQIGLDITMTDVAAFWFQLPMGWGVKNLPPIFQAQQLLT